jgi:Fe-S oxidoreductases
MLREETVFGPIKSRRLGTSLGVNLLPVNGKICTFDCIYCECGWNADGRDDTRLPSAEDVRQALESKLISLRAEAVSIDTITFSGDGEPTINPEFPQIIDDTLRLRDEYYPSAKVSVLSNATRVHVPSVFEALRKVDNPIMKIDAPTNELIALIDNPAPGYDVARVIEALKGFNGDFVLQTMFLRSPSFDSSSSEVLVGWMDIVRELKPREIMVYTIDRPTPAQNLSSFTEEQMRALVQPLIDEGFSIQIKGSSRSASAPAK